VARDMGNAHLECVVLCNLGMVYDGLVRFDEARDQFEAALARAQSSLCDPRITVRIVMPANVPVTARKRARH